MEIGDLQIDTLSYMQGLAWVQVGPEIWQPVDILNNQLSGVEVSGIYVVWQLIPPSQVFCLNVDHGEVSEGIQSFLQSDKCKVGHVHAQWAKWPTTVDHMTKQGMVAYVVRELKPCSRQPTATGDVKKLVVVNLPDKPSPP